MLISELKRQIAACDAEIKKLGNPDTELSLCKNLLRGATEKKDSDGIKKWNARISAAEKNRIEYYKLGRKKQVLKSAVNVLEDPFNRKELSLLDVIQKADAAYRSETGERVNFNILVKPEDYEVTRARPLPQSNRLWRHGRMSQIMGGV